MIRSVQNKMVRTIWNSARPITQFLSFVVVLLAIGAVVQRSLDIDAIRGSIGELGLSAPLVFIALAMLKSVLFLPFVPIIVLVGLGSVLFGAVYGACYSGLGLTVGACVAFLAARHAVSDFAATLKRGRLERLDEVVSSNGFLASLGLRLVFFGSTALNYVSGLTSMTFTDYVLGTLIGLMPRMFILSFASESLQEPHMWTALLTYPYVLLLVLFLASWLGGVLLLTVLAKSYARDIWLGSEQRS